MKHTPLLFGLAAALILAGCGDSKGSYKPTPIEKPKSVELATGQETKLFPVKEGNEWTFESETNITNAPKQDDVLTFRIGKVTEKEGGIVDFEMKILNEGSTTEEQIWRRTPKGLYMIQARIPSNKEGTQFKMQEFLPPQPIITFELDVAVNKEWLGTGPLPAGGGGWPASGASKIKHRFVGEQTADTPLDKYTAHVFELEQDWDVPGIDQKALAAAIEKATGATSKPVTDPNKPKETPLAGTEGKKEEEDLNEISKPQIGKGKSAVTSYLVPDVGIVRLRQEIFFNNVQTAINVVQVLKLKNMSLK